jgi:F0F1-type ATP synthase membrane subunit c/vacuolar-type H+-ATPase subunit K
MKLEGAHPEKISIKMIQANIIGTGLATTGLIGAGVGIGVCQALILGVARNPSIVAALSIHTHYD